RLGDLVEKTKNSRREQYGYTPSESLTDQSTTQEPHPDLPDVARAQTAMSDMLAEIATQQEADASQPDITAQYTQNDDVVLQQFADQLSRTQGLPARETHTPQVPGKTAVPPQQTADSMPLAKSQPERKTLQSGEKSSVPAGTRRPEYVRYAREDIAADRFINPPSESEEDPTQRTPLSDPLQENQSASQKPVPPVTPTKPTENNAENTGLANDLTPSVKMMIQPIVTIPDQATLFFHGAAQLEQKIDTDAIGGKPTADILQLIDAVATSNLSNLLERADKLGPDGGVFLDISALTLRNQEFLAQLSEILTEHQDKLNRIVFCLDKQELALQWEHCEATLKKMSKFGIRFAIKGTKTLDTSDPIFRGINCQFLIIDMGRLEHRMKIARASDMLADTRRLRQMKIYVVVTGITGGSMLKPLQQMEVSYAQGDFFGKPILLNTS
ncbi:MAG: EAL domain-containing protein, partial [Pseudomonadota bacterium]